jgi:hypothetical protein
MPLQNLQFRPGVNREGTTLANEGGWFDCDKVRFRSGYPEKIGGWSPLSTNTFLGVCRSLWNWVTLKNYNLLGLGTNLKFYIENGGAYFDITPIRETNGNTAGPGITLSVITLTASGTTLTVSDSGADSLQVNDFITIAGAGTIGGVNVNGQYQITSVISGTSYTVTLPTSASGSNSAASITIAYQINTGFPIYTVGTGWGAGPWSRGTWGSGYTTGFGLQLRLWSQINFGEYLIFNPRGGPLYIWQPGPGATPNFTTRGVILSPASITPPSWASTVTDSSCPVVCNQILVSDSTRIVIAFGCNDYGSSTLDPLLIRWGAQESYSEWAPSATNQAGSYRLSHGSEIVGALQTRQEIVVFTDAAIYSMQYLGPPYVWGFTLLADNISIVSPNAIATAAGVVYWMGTDKFYVYAGRVETLPCAVRQFVFSSINRDQEAQFFAGSNEGYSEIWWYYCSIEGADGTGTVENPNTTVDRYVIFNYLDRVWYYGKLGRTAWLDSPLRQYPQATTTENYVVFHENNVNDGYVESAEIRERAINAYVQSSDFDIGDGHNYGFVWRMLPDITFDGSFTAGNTSEAARPTAVFTLRPRQNPGSNYGAAPVGNVSSGGVPPQTYATQTSYNVQEFTEIIYTRVRGRQMALRVSSNKLGTQWQLGVPRMDVRPDGRR